MISTQDNKKPWLLHATPLPFSSDYPPSRTAYIVCFRGVIVSMIVATTAQFLADHYSTPVMLLALLLGMAVSFLGEEGRTVAGISFTGKTLLRVGGGTFGCPDQC